MSSSDQKAAGPEGNPAAFLHAFVAGIVASVLLLVALILVVDPAGAGPGNAFCGRGAKSTESTYVKPLLPGILRPRTVIMGTSRVQFGFDGAALRQLEVAGPAANLGIAAALPSDWRQLGTSVLQNASQPVIYLGVDFNSAYQRPNSPLAPQAEGLVARAFARLRGAWFSNQALQILPDALPLCAVGYGTDGTFARAVDVNGPMLGNLQTTERMKIGLRSVYTAGLIDQRLAEIDSLLTQWQRAGATVVVFSAPYRPEAMQAYAEEGLTASFNRYHQRLHEIARSHSAAFVDFRSPEAVTSLHLVPCPQGGIGCHYYDLIHYRPEVGAAMAPVLYRAALEVRD